MNHFNLKTTKDDDGQIIGPNEVHMHLSDVTIAGPLGEQMRLAFEIEMLQGKQTPDPDGGMHYHFELNDEKIAMLRQWLMLAFFNPEPN